MVITWCYGARIYANNVMPYLLYLEIVERTSSFPHSLKQKKITRSTILDLVYFSGTFLLQQKRNNNLYNMFLFFTLCFTFTVSKICHLIHLYYNLWKETLLICLVKHFKAFSNLLSSSVVTVIGSLAFPSPFAVDANTKML